MPHDPFNAMADLCAHPAGGSGPLAGVRVGIKCNIAVAGLPHTGGLLHLKDQIAARDARVVTQLRSAGASIIGTTTMHEGALGATTDNAHYGRTHNPHRHGHTPGGSSGGSGAAVAAGPCWPALRPRSGWARSSACLRKASRWSNVSGPRAAPVPSMPAAA
jgi:aspartyl-tRNA(Asn)/glutamyl-tRNA(Gln) amidotransferase subunit A